MEIIYLSRSIQDAQNIEQVVEIVNEGACEGLGGIEFTSEMLAGCYIYEACENENDEAERVAHAEILKDAGANFDESEAVAYAAKLESAQ